MLERVIWWMDMCSAMILLVTGLYTACVFADVLAPVYTGLVLLGTIVCFLLQFESLGRRHQAICLDSESAAAVQFSA
jgi:Ni,Fe-hydrogenase I cytochrome b subunit